MLDSEYNFCQICSSSQNSIFAENTLKRVIKIWKKIQEFILTIKETTWRIFETIAILNMSNLRDSNKKWLLRTMRR